MSAVCGIVLPFTIVPRYGTVSARGQNIVCPRKGCPQSLRQQFSKLASFHVSSRSRLFFSPVLATAENGSNASSQDDAAKLADLERQAAELRKRLAIQQQLMAKAAAKPQGSDLEFSLPKDLSDMVGGRPGFTEADMIAAAEEEAKESGTTPISADDVNKTVTKRLLIGVVASGVLAGLSLTSVPRAKPSRPLFLYLVGVLGLRSLLDELDRAITDQRWEDVKALSKAYAQPPIDAKSNLENAVAWLDSTQQYNYAIMLARDIMEYTEEANYSKYFENRGIPSEKQQREFADFSKQAVQAAKKSLKEFLSIMPRDAVEAAEAQVRIRLSDS
eukprot:jgi/Mesvir1/6169/Mv00863-RA.1